MNKVNLNEFFKNVQVTMTKNAPSILTGVGIAGMIGTTVMAVRATPKAVKLIDEKKEEMNQEKLPPIEIIKATWKCYAPAVVTGVASAACLIRANSINTRRNAALVTAYNLSKTALSEYKTEVKEIIGEKKEQVVMDKLSQKKVDEDPKSNKEVVVTNKGQTLCYDGVFGRYFLSDMDTLKRAMNEINRRIVSNMYVSLNEFYSEIGLSPTEIGDDLGWNLDDGQIDIYFSTTLAENDTPCLVIHYNMAPKYEFSRIV